MTFGEQLRELRRTKGLSQNALAKQSGVSPRSIFGYEAGTTYPRTREILERLARALEVAPDDLLRVNGKTTVNSLDYENYPPKAQAKIATEQVTRLLLGDDLDAADKDEMLQAIQSAYWDYRRR